MSQQTKLPGSSRVSKNGTTRRRGTAASKTGQYRVGLDLHRKGDLAGARMIYCDILEKHPRNADAWHMLGVALHQVGVNDSAADCLEQAVTIRPRNADQLAHLALIYRALGRRDDAILALEMALSLRPDHIPARNNLGVIYLESNEPQLAEQQFLKVLEHDPNNTEAQLHLARI